MGIAVPLVFAALMASEYIYNAIRSNGYQTPRDSAVSVMLQFPRDGRARGVVPRVPRDRSSHAVTYARNAKFTFGACRLRVDKRSVFGS